MGHKFMHHLRYSTISTMRAAGNTSTDRVICLSTMRCHNDPTEPKVSPNGTHQAEQRETGNEGGSQHGQKRPGARIAADMRRPGAPEASRLLAHGRAAGKGCGRLLGVGAGAGADADKLGLALEEAADGRHGAAPGAPTAAEQKSQHQHHGQGNGRHRQKRLAGEEGLQTAKRAQQEELADAEGRRRSQA